MCICINIYVCMYVYIHIYKYLYMYIHIYRSSTYYIQLLYTKKVKAGVKHLYICLEKNIEI